MAEAPTVRHQTPEQGVLVADGEGCTGMHYYVLVSRYMYTYTHRHRDIYLYTDTSNIPTVE